MTWEKDEECCQHLKNILSSEDKVAGWTSFDVDKACKVIDLIKRHLGTDLYSSEKKKIEEENCDDYVNELISCTLSHWEEVEKRFLGS